MKGYPTSANSNLSGYVDSRQISNYAKTAMAWANGKGLINGNSSRQLMPTGSATRAQAAAILTRFCKNIIPSENHNTSEQTAPIVPQTPTLPPVEATSYNVTFDLNYPNAGIYQVLSVKEGERVTAPKDPIRDGYYFLGWYTSSKSGTQFNFNTVIRTITTLYARWKRNNISVSGGSGSSSGGSSNNGRTTIYIFGD